MSDLPNGWEWSTIGEVAEVNPRLSKADLSDDDPVSFVPMASVSAESGQIDASDVQPAGPLKKKSFRQFADGDVLVAKITPSMENGKGAVARGLASGRGFGSTEFHVLRPAAVEPDFLLHFVLQPCFRGNAARNMTGTAGQLRVPPDYLRQHRIPVPPLPEQRRIVAAIEEHSSRLDAAEVSVVAARKRLEPLRRASAERLLSSQAWGWTTLGEIADIRGGVTKDAKREREDDLIEVPFLRVANVQRGYLDLDEVKVIRVPKAKARALELEVGDVLFNEGGDRDKLGRGWIWEGQIDRCIHQNHVFRARLTSDQFEPRFVSTHGNTWGRAWFEKNGKQTTNLASLNLTTLRRFPVPDAPRAEQRKIVAVLERVESEIARAEDSVAMMELRLSALRRSILAAAFSGRLVAQDPSDEPASALLERTAVGRAASKPSRRKKKAAS